MVGLVAVGLGVRIWGEGGWRLEERWGMGYKDGGDEWSWSEGSGRFAIFFEIFLL